MASLKDIKVNINVDTADFIKSLRQLQESIKMDNVRILKGWTKEESEELEDAKETGNLGNFLHNITGYPEDTNCGYVWDNYHKASSREQISIIQDIVDFYTDKAKFPEQKYYIQLIKNNDDSYLNRSTVNSFCMACCYQPDEIFQTEFTEQEIKDIDPRYMAFAVPVEAK